MTVCVPRVTSYEYTLPPYVRTTQYVQVYSTYSTRYIRILEQYEYIPPCMLVCWCTVSWAVWCCERYPNYFHHEDGIPTEKRQKAAKPFHVQISALLFSGRRGAASAYAVHALAVFERKIKEALGAQTHSP